MTDETRNKIEDWLKLITYKPGFHFELQRPPHGNFEYLSIAAEVTCSDTGNKITIYSGSTVMPQHTTSLNDFCRFLRDQILVLETHEMNEFLKVEGVKHFEPHPKTHYTMSEIKFVPPPPLDPDFESFKYRAGALNMYGFSAYAVQEAPAQKWWDIFDWFKRL